QGTDGIKNGVTFSSATATSNDSGVAAGHVIRLRGSGGRGEGCYEIVSVDSQTQLTLSVVRAQSDAAPIAPPTGDQPNYGITSYDPQIEEASDLLLRRFGIKEEGSESVSVEDIMDVRALRLVCVYAVLAMLYSGMAEWGDGTTDFWTKAHHYQAMCRLARNRVRLEIDTDDDGIAEQVRDGNTTRLQRE
ncbi:MAG: hypothetical protein K9M57_05950, partial [Phycisphaerae bacterium]|nr:hypothetical protein [Phycisphaerae bacterium]